MTAAWWVKVEGPRLTDGPFGSGESHSMEKAEDVLRRSDGSLEVLVAAREIPVPPPCTHADYVGAAKVTCRYCREPQARPRPARVVVYAAGQWTKFTVGPIVKRDA